MLECGVFNEVDSWFSMCFVPKSTECYLKALSAIGTLISSFAVLYVQTTTKRSYQSDINVVQKTQEVQNQTYDLYHTNVIVDDEQAKH